MDPRHTSQTDFMQRISVHWLFHEVNSFRLQVQCMTSVTFVFDSFDKDYAVWYESIHRIGIKICSKKPISLQTHVCSSKDK